MDDTEEDVPAPSLLTADGTGLADETGNGPTTPPTDAVRTTAAEPLEASPQSPGNRAKHDFSANFGNAHVKDPASQNNNEMLATLEYLEQEVGFTRMDNLSLQKEIEWLQTQNLDLKNRLRAVATDFKQRGGSSGEKDDQMKLLLSQKDELLRLLKAEQRANLRDAQATHALIQELGELKSRHEALQTTLIAQEKVVTSAFKESYFRNEEIGLLRQELGNLRACHAELKMKMELDVEALEKQVRDRKETQYKLVEQQQNLLEGRRRAEEQVVALETKSKAIFEKYGKLGAHLQHETQAKKSQEEEVEELAAAVESLRQENNALMERVDTHEQERLEVEENSRRNKEQLHDMSQMVFQLLGTLKLSESRNLDTAEAVRAKEQEVSAAEVAYTAIARKEKIRIKTESEKKNRRERARSLQKHNLHVSQRSKNEVNNKLKEEEGERMQLEKMLNVLGARLTYLLEKSQADGRHEASPREDTRDMEVEVTSIRFRDHTPDESPSSKMVSPSSTRASTLSSSSGAFGAGGSRGLGGSRGGQRAGREGEEGGSLAMTSELALAKHSAAEETRGVVQRQGWTGRVGGLESPALVSKK